MSMETDNNTIEANCAFLNEDQIKKAFRETLAEIAKERYAAGDTDPNWKRTTICLNIVPPSKREKIGETSEWHGLFYAWISNPRVKQILLGISETGERIIQVVDPNWISPKFSMNVDEWTEMNPQPEIEEVDEKSKAINAIRRKKDWNYVSPEEQEHEDALEIWEKSLQDYKNQYSAAMITIELEPFPIVPVQYTESQYTQCVNLWKNNILSKYTDFDQDFLDNFTNNLLTKFDQNDTIENNKVRYNELLDNLKVFYGENQFDADLDSKLLPPFSSVYMKASNVFKKFPPNPNRYNNAPVVDSSMLISKLAELWITSKLLYPLISQFSSDKEIDKKTGQLKFPIITEIQVNDKKLGPRKIFTIKFSNKQIYKQNCSFARMMIRKLTITNPQTKETTLLLLNWKYENSYSDNNSVKSGTSRGSDGKYQNQKYQNPPRPVPPVVDNEKKSYLLGPPPRPVEVKLEQPLPPARGWNIPLPVPPVVENERKSSLLGPQEKNPVQIQRQQVPQRQQQKNQQYSNQKNEHYHKQRNQQHFNQKNQIAVPVQRSNSPQGRLKRGESPQPIRRTQSPPRNTTSEESSWQVPKNQKKLQPKKDKK
jgi:hypothetical protein